MSHIDIRLAERNDLPSLRALQERSLRTLGRPHYSSTQIDTFITRIGTMDDYLVADRTYLVAEIAGTVLGCGGWTTRLPGYARTLPNAAHQAGRRKATVRSIFVDPQAARRGVGSRVMNAVEDAMRGEGFEIAELGATDNAAGFYRAIGYRPLREMRIALGDGIDFGLTIMRKRLVPARDEPTSREQLVA